MKQEVIVKNLSYFPNGISKIFETVIFFEETDDKTFGLLIPSIPEGTMFPHGAGSIIEIEELPDTSMNITKSIKSIPTKILFPEVCPDCLTKTVERKLRRENSTEEALFRMCPNFFCYKFSNSATYRILTQVTPFTHHLIEYITKFPTSGSPVNILSIGEFFDILYFEYLKKDRKQKFSHLPNSDFYIALEEGVLRFLKDEKVFDSFWNIISYPKKDEQEIRDDLQKINPILLVQGSLKKEFMTLKFSTKEFVRANLDYIAFMVEKINRFKNDKREN